MVSLGKANLRVNWAVSFTSQSLCVPDVLFFFIFFKLNGYNETRRTGNTMLMTFTLF